MLLRLVLLTLIMFYTSDFFAQNEIEEIVLEEIQITSKKKKKTKKYKISGMPLFHFYEQNDFIVTGVSELPIGDVKAVNFTFNNKYTRVVGSIFDEINIDFIDVEFGLMLFEMKNDGTIGNLIADSETKFIISKEHQGDFRIELSEINLPKKGFFIGIKVLSETMKNKASFYVSMCDNDKYTSYESSDFSKTNSKETYLNLANSNLKMTFEIEQ